MALATRCPHCQTTFRVAHDQLKLRAGMVRCGSCQQIFNGIEQLVPADPASSPGIIPAAPAVPAIPPAEIIAPSSASAYAVEPPSEEPTQAGEAPYQESIESADATPDEPAPLPLPTIEFDIPGEATNDDIAGLLAAGPVTGWAEIESPLNVSEPEAGPAELPITSDDLYFSTEAPPAMGTPQSAPEAETTNESADQAAEQAAEQLDPEPAVEPETDLEPETDPDEQSGQESVAATPESPATPSVDGDIAAREAEAELAAFVEEPEFVKRGRRKQRLGRTLRIAMAVSVFFLLAGLILQSAYTFRNVLAIAYPQTKPLLTQACALIRCQVGLPAQIDTLSIDNDRALLTLDKEKTLFEFNVLIRNHSNLPQAWPHVELTLNDAAGKAVARRVFKPKEFPLPPQELARGIAPSSEQAVKMFFKMPQMKASGYAVQIFYP